MTNAEQIYNRIDKLQNLGNETLTNITEIIRGHVKFYNDCLESWEIQQIKGGKWSEEDIKAGLIASEAGLNMAYGIVNELRIKYLKD